MFVTFPERFVPVGVTAATSRRFTTVRSSVYPHLVDVNNFHVPHAPRSKPYQNSLQLLSKEITSATASAEYLSQKHAWGEGRLAVARLLSLVSPAGHSLVSWAAACGQTEVVEILMNHGASAELGDEVRTVASSIIQVCASSIIQVCASSIIPV